MLGLFRILLGALIFYDFIVLFQMRDFLLGGAELVVPTAKQLPLDISVIDSISYACLFSLGIGSCFLMLGWFWRPASSLLLLSYLFLINRWSPMVHGGDYLIAWYLVWLLFLPCDQHWVLSFKKSPRVLKKTYLLSMGGFAFLFQTLLFLFFVGFNKNGPSWVDGSAVFKVLNYSLMTGYFSDVVPLSPTASALLTYAALFFELAFPFLLLLPFSNFIFRKFALYSYLCFFVTLFCLFRTGTMIPFSMVILIPLICFPKHGWQSDVLVQSPNIHGFSSSAITLLLTLVFLGALSSSPRISKSIRQLISSVTPTESLGLRQPWLLFAPEPSSNTGHFAFYKSSTLSSTKNYFNFFSLAETDRPDFQQDFYDRDVAGRRFQKYFEKFLGPRTATQERLKKTLMNSLCARLHLAPGMYIGIDFYGVNLELQKSREGFVRQILPPTACQDNG
jgi:hypothetical protein